MNTILRKNNRGGGIQLLDFRLEYKATVTETVWCWYKNRNIDQWKRIANPEISPCTYGQSIYDKGGKSNVGKTVSSTNGAGKTGQPCVKK